jgi:hypothetical protein
MYVEMEAMRDQLDLSMRIDSKEMIINKPLSHVFTVTALPLHGSEETLKLVTGVKCSLVTDFIARYQYGVINNGLKQPVTDRALINNGLYKLVADSFNLCNGLYLTSITKN